MSQRGRRIYASADRFARDAFGSPGRRGAHLRIATKPATAPARTTTAAEPLSPPVGPIVDPALGESCQLLVRRFLFLERLLEELSRVDVFLRESL